MPFASLPRELLIQICYYIDPLDALLVPLNKDFHKAATESMRRFLKQCASEHHCRFDHYVKQCNIQRSRLLREERMQNEWKSARAAKRWNRWLKRRKRSAEDHKCTTAEQAAEWYCSMFGPERVSFFYSVPARLMFWATYRFWKLTGQRVCALVPPDHLSDLCGSRGITQIRYLLVCSGVQCTLEFLGRWWPGENTSIFPLIVRTPDNVELNYPSEPIPGAIRQWWDYSIQTNPDWNAHYAQVHSHNRDYNKRLLAVQFSVVPKVPIDLRKLAELL